MNEMTDELDFSARSTTSTTTHRLLSSRFHGFVHICLVNENVIIQLHKL